ncbi:MFS transporter [Kyrpidia tusciae]|uniref:MFS transporter n=1 Tax=Kyrpidia tusciae TaxID=33943 RepID=UPI0002D8927B|nr:MFS transporter [Kyrpidia tusciae]
MESRISFWGAPAKGWAPKTFGMIAWLPEYLQDIRHFSFSDFGVFASLPYLVGSVFVLVFGSVSDRAKHRAPFVAVALILASVSIWPAASVTDHRMSAYFLALGVGSIGIGISSFWAILQRLTPG